MNPLTLISRKMEPSVNEFRLPKRGATSPAEKYLVLANHVRKTTLSPIEVTSILDSIKNLKHKILLEFLYFCSIKLDEAVNIQPDDIDLKQSKVKVGERNVTIPSRLIPQIEFVLRYVSRSGKFFFGDKGNPISVREARTILQNAAESVGIYKDVSPNIHIPF